MRRKTWDRLTPSEFDAALGAWEQRRLDDYLDSLEDEGEEETDPAWESLLQTPEALELEKEDEWDTYR